MTRELLKQALEALQLCANGEDDVLLTRDALSALREALEQPVQEPVRWMYDWQNDGLTVTDWVTSDKGEAYSKAHTNIRPLYTEPPQRQPLTDDEIFCLYRTVWSPDENANEVLAFARAIEAAHGIGEKK